MNLEQLVISAKNFSNLSPSDKINFIKDLRSIAKVSTKTFEPSCSVCPYTKIPLHSPCSLKKCPYWVKKEFSNNCALHYMSSLEKDSLSVEQISFLFDKNLSRVDSLNKDALKLIQRVFLKNLLVSKEVPRFSFLKGFCVNCQTSMPENIDPVLSLEEGFGYCSRECKRSYQPDIWKVERFFETDFLTIVQYGSELFNFYYLEEVLGFQPNVLRNRLEKLKKSGKD